jgi:hypothetical protein
MTMAAISTLVVGWHIGDSSRQRGSGAPSTGAYRMLGELLEAEIWQGLALLSLVLLWYTERPLS